MNQTDELYHELDREQDAITADCNSNPNNERLVDNLRLVLDVLKNTKYWAFTRREFFEGNYISKKYGINWRCVDWIIIGLKTKKLITEEECEELRLLFVSERDKRGFSINDYDWLGYYGTDRYRNRSKTRDEERVAKLKFIVTVKKGLDNRKAFIRELIHKHSV